MPSTFMFFDITNRFGISTKEKSPQLSSQKKRTGGPGDPKRLRNVGVILDVFQPQPHFGEKQTAQQKTREKCHTTKQPRWL